MLFKRRNILKSMVLWKSLQHALQRVRFHIRSAQVSNSYLKTPLFFLHIFSATHMCYGRVMDVKVILWNGRATMNLYKIYNNK